MPRHLALCRCDRAVSIYLKRNTFFLVCPLSAMYWTLTTGNAVLRFLRGARRLPGSSVTQGVPPASAYRLIRELGIDDPRLAFLHIACQAVSHYERYDEVMQLSRQAQFEAWTEAVRRACVSGELPAATDIAQAARTFLLLSSGEFFESLHNDDVPDDDDRVGLCESYDIILRS